MYGNFDYFKLPKIFLKKTHITLIYVNILFTTDIQTLTQSYTIHKHIRVQTSMYINKNHIYRQALPNTFCQRYEGRRGEKKNELKTPVNRESYICFLIHL